MGEADLPGGASKSVRAESMPPQDELAGSVTRWLGGLKAGDERALEPLWGRYYAMLVERAARN